jgi:hypothetical protein
MRSGDLEEQGDSQTSNLNLNSELPRGEFAKLGNGWAALISLQSHPAQGIANQPFTQG